MGRLIRRPRVGDLVDSCRYGDTRVDAVYDHGLTLDVTDVLGRHWTIHRAPIGWWTLVTDPSHDLTALRRSDGRRWRAECRCGESWTRPRKATVLAFHRHHVRDAAVTPGCGPLAGPG